jgi:hypothetical protein
MKESEPKTTGIEETAPGQGDPQKGKEELSQQELEAQSGEQLPDREQMSLVNANLALPVNAAVAANVLSDGSIAYADAEQGNTIEQGNLGGTLPTGQ